MMRTNTESVGRRIMWGCVLGVGLMLGWVGCGGKSSSPTPDAAIDAEVTPDASAVDASSNCGNGALDTDELCDGVELNGQTCGGLGLPAGTLACRTDCTLDTSGCAVCDDAICSDGETAVSCPEDCGVVDVATGVSHTCAVLADGSVWCWGARDGHRMGGTGDVSAPVMVPGINTAVEVAAGRHHTCVRTVLDEIFCWGANGYGQTGVEPVSHEVFPPVQVTTGIELFAGGDKTCIRTINVETFCWGRLYAGATPLSAPLELQGGGHLALGKDHLCYTRFGWVWCQGRNDHGQLGIGRGAWSELGTITNHGGIAALGAGASHSCYTVTTGGDTGLYCWGNNEHGQLGRQPGADVFVAEWIAALMPQLIKGGLRHTCAKESVLPGGLLCWGFNARGQLGTGTVTAGYEFRAVDIPVVERFDSGAEHVCAILPDQTLRCWGDNRLGQIGNGSSDQVVASPSAPTRLGPL